MKFQSQSVLFYLVVVGFQLGSCLQWDFNKDGYTEIKKNKIKCETTMDFPVPEADP